ncbi:carbohydrate esterase family 4 protein [Dendrothele bispora CBS 962.96]|uniref:Carbohydrate esterase family 4 protein n=1 Tax=Dendrothele bispora (strain CBS 962.96) TaxID=1314807 RepID=A0A4S8MVF7_DENBC|nr:carbohydrate esterase family 4 protein [Dendrothele bispora CBS 962.96]
MFTLPSLITLSLAVAAFAHPTPGKRQALAQVITTCNTPNTIALTFDDGPYIYGPDIVDTLDQHGIKGTFFYNGDNYRCIYDQDMQSNVMYAYSHGHQVASHTWHHYDLTTLSWDQIHDEMWRTEQALERILGVSPAFMRPPYGNYNDLVRQASAVRGQKLVLWDFDDGDSTGSSVSQSEADYDQLIRDHPNTVIALNHETYETSAHQVIPYAVQQLQNAGYQFATVAECVGLEPYQSVGSPQTNDGSWGC